jgi:hypothetical protein
MTTTADNTLYYTKLRAFEEFHEANPQVWERFAAMADELRSKGYRHYSHDTLISVIRFQHDIKTNGVPFKIANEQKAFYGRMYVKERECIGFFSFNRMRGEPCSHFELVSTAAAGEAS